jgi:hypothetical protein
MATTIASTDVGGTGLSTVGTNGQVLTSNGTTLSWQTPSTSSLTGTLAVANGGTGLTSLTAGYIPYGNGTSAFGNSANLFWDNTNARLGVGTSSPVGKLQVDLTANGSAANNLTLNNPGSGGGTGSSLNFYNTGVTQPFTARINSVDDGAYGYALVFSTKIGGSAGAGALTERMRLTSGGYLGIGTASPSKPLVVSDGTIQGQINPVGANSACYIGTINNYRVAFNVNDSERMTLDTNGRLGINTSGPSYLLDVNGTANITGTANIGGLFTTSGGIYFSNTMYLTASGATTANSIGIRMSESYGVVWNCGNSTVWHHNVINGSSCVGFASAGSNFGNGNILCTGTLTQGYSDIRLKTKVSDINNALEKVCSIDTFVYVENELAAELGYTNKKEQLGVSAQSVEKVLPEVVGLAPVDMMGHPDTHEVISKSGDNYLTVDYTRLVPALISAIKELNDKFEEYKASHP